MSLTAAGRDEAAAAGALLASSGYQFDLAYTSVLKRAIHTLWAVQVATGLEWVPVVRSWRLNERHYGALQGLNKQDTVAQHGEAQVKVWRRAYATPPPRAPPDDPRHPSHDRRYAVYGLTPEQLPSTESLADTVARVMPLWAAEIAPAVRAGKRVLIAAHGNSIRALW